MTKCIMTEQQKKELIKYLDFKNIGKEIIEAIEKENDNYVFYLPPSKNNNFVKYLYIIKKLKITKIIVNKEYYKQYREEMTNCTLRMAVKDLELAKEMARKEHKTFSQFANDLICEKIK